MKKVLVLLVLISIGILISCTKKGSFEKAGDRMDEIVDNVKDGDPVLKKKGPIEKAGEAIDETFR